MANQIYLKLHSEYKLLKLKSDILPYELNPSKNKITIDKKKLSKLLIQIKKISSLFFDLHDIVQYEYFNIVYSKNISKDLKEKFINLLNLTVDAISTLEGIKTVVQIRIAQKNLFIY
ncbi:MAG: hypothetical protein JXA94_04250 [Parachlamydiales bacterium]|nr:hypothetical protein [Parachlamydiales bacterium]